MDQKDHIFISFHMFAFYGNIIFSELLFKRKCKKAASFHKFGLLFPSIKYSYTIVVRNYEIFYVAL